MSAWAEWTSARLNWALLKEQLLYGFIVCKLHAVYGLFTLKCYQLRALGATERASETLPMKYVWMYTIPLRLHYQLKYSYCGCTESSLKMLFCHVVVWMDRHHVGVIAKLRECMQNHWNCILASRIWEDLSTRLVHWALFIWTTTKFINSRTLYIYW